MEDEARPQTPPLPPVNVGHAHVSSSSAARLRVSPSSPRHLHPSASSPTAAATTTTATTTAPPPDLHQSEEHQESQPQIMSEESKTENSISTNNVGEVAEKSDELSLPPPAIAVSSSSPPLSDAPKDEQQQANVQPTAATAETATAEVVSSEQKQESSAAAVLSSPPPSKPPAVLFSPEGGGAAVTKVNGEDDAVLTYEEVFQILSRRNEAWGGVFEEIHAWFEELYRTEKAHSATLKRLPTLVTAINTNKSHQDRSAVRAMASVISCCCNREAEERGGLAKVVNVDTGVRMANLVQDAQKRSRSIRDRQEQLLGGLGEVRNRLKEAQQMRGAAAAGGGEGADPWLAERLIDGEHKAEKMACSAIPTETQLEIMMVKEAESVRAELLRATLRKYLDARRDMLTAMQKDVLAAMQAVDEIDAEADWRHFLSRFPILEDYRHVSLEPVAQGGGGGGEGHHKEALLSGYLKKQGKIYGATRLFYVVSQHGFLHEFQSEESLRPDASYHLVPSKFEVSTVTPESFEFCYRHSDQKPAGLSSFFVGNETRITLIAKDKAEMLQWLTSLHNFAIHRK